MDGICPLWHSKVFSHNQVGLLQVGNHRNFRKNYFEVQRRRHARVAMQELQIIQGFFCSTLLNDSAKF